MEQYKIDFLNNCFDSKVLQFGDFTLKSGKHSPYFFNMGNIHNGDSIQRVAYAYAKSIVDNKLDVDMLFGPAYKGITLVVATGIAMLRYDKKVGFAFNRKEEKRHGDGGVIVGKPIEGHVVIVDDVITSGMSVHEAHTIITDKGGTVDAVVVALDRCEEIPVPSTTRQTGVSLLEQELQVKVLSIVTVFDLLEYVRQHEIVKVHHHYELMANYVKENCLGN